MRHYFSLGSYALFFAPSLFSIESSSPLLAGLSSSVSPPTECSNIIIVTKLPVARGSGGRRLMSNNFIPFNHSISVFLGISSAQPPGRFVVGGAAGVQQTKWLKTALRYMAANATRTDRMCHDASVRNDSVYRISAIIIHRCSENRFVSRNCFLRHNTAHRPRTIKTRTNSGSRYEVRISFRFAKPVPRRIDRCQQRSNEKIVYAMSANKYRLGGADLEKNILATTNEKRQNRVVSSWKPNTNFGCAKVSTR